MSSLLRIPQEAVDIYLAIVQQSNSSKKTTLSLLFAHMRCKRADIIFIIFLKMIGNIRLSLQFFSAPNYCDMYNNMAAVMMISQEGYSFNQISWSPHPFYLPDMIDGLNWSFPFVIENLTDLSLAILNICKKRDETEETQTATSAPQGASSAEVPDAFNSRVKTVGGMLRMLKQLREEREELLKLKQFAADSNDAIENFKKAITLDKDNEKSPLAKVAVVPPTQMMRRSRSKTQ
eukprot:TRINITY_DN1227_c0_g1_i1.p1 TRINITY_DN1227_c0_g1~~TRINITY_DN1227_c0_g1_i1.p1  ORF type:complete len:234 (-),score=42.33 TRINITY_DN1227_c0_g1_i1:483-1184(-)